MRHVQWWLIAVSGCLPQPDGAASIAPSDMRLVPGAEFRMGTDSLEFPAIVARTGLSDSGPLGAEYPARIVRVADFYMDTVDVTNDAFAEFVQAEPGWGPLEADSSLHNGRYLEHWVNEVSPANLGDHPVTFITWQSAAAYCTWRGKRLPTEAEYEWAAQQPGGGGAYPWGDAPPSDGLVSWGGNGIDGTMSVGSYPPNARGLYDMAGNVWRFVSDVWLGSYAEARAASQPVDSVTARRVVRGGSWGANAANLRVRYRAA